MLALILIIISHLKQAVFVFLKPTYQFKDSLTICIVGQYSIVALEYLIKAVTSLASSLWLALLIIM